jgi:hypothetical protein
MPHFGRKLEKKSKKTLEKAAKKSKKALQKVTAPIITPITKITAPITQPVVDAATQVVNFTTHTVQNAVYETNKAATDVLQNVGHELEKGGKELEKAGKTVIQTPEKVLRKMARSMVEDKINDAYEKKMNEAIADIQKQLAESKAKDKALIDQQITAKLNEVTEQYKALTSKSALDETEIQLFKAIRLVTAALYECRLGFKEAIEEVLSFDFDDEAVITFLARKPLRLALQDFTNEQPTEALSVLLQYFDKNIDKLSAENKEDYVCLKNHVIAKLGINADKEESEVYIAKMVQTISADTIAGIIKSSTTGISINTSVDNNNELANQSPHSSTTRMLAKLNDAENLIPKPATETNAAISSHEGLSNTVTPNIATPNIITNRDLDNNNKAEVTNETLNSCNPWLSFDC